MPDQSPPNLPTADRPPVLDPEPLLMLHRRGIAYAELDQLRHLFYDNITSTLGMIRNLASMPDGANTAALGALTHRVRGACASMGTDALGECFEKLALDAAVLQPRLADVDAVFEATRAALDRLLDEMAQ